MLIKILKVTCPSCRGSGYYRSIGFDFDEGCSTCGGSGDEYERRKMKNGNGYIYVRFEVLKEECLRCGGTGRIEGTRTTHASGFFGEYRKTTRFTDTCNYCLGEGRQLIAFYRSQCPECGGSGKISYWEKSFFGTEYKKYKRGKNCAGSGEVLKKDTRVFKDDLSSILKY